MTQKQAWFNNLLGLAVVSIFSILVWVTYNKVGWEVAVNFAFLYLLFIMSLESKQTSQTINAPQKQEMVPQTLIVTTINEIDFETTPLTFQENALLEMIKENNFVDVESAYLVKSSFINARLKDKKINVGNLPSHLIPKLIEKAEKEAKSEEVTQFDNIENIFEN